MSPTANPLLTFLASLIVLTTLAGALLIATYGVGGMLYLIFFEWTPGLATLFTLALHRSDITITPWSWLPPRRTIASYALPLLYIAPVYLLTWALLPDSFRLAPFVIASAKTVGFPAHPRLATFALFVPLSFTLGLLTRFPYTLGEELGWRGILLPQLRERYSFPAASAITGLIWAIWHYPLLYAFGLFSSPHARVRIPLFTIMVISLSFVFGWLRYRTNSLWACVLMHASHNAFLQTFFDPLTAPSANTASITSEFGFGLALTVTLVALWLTLSVREAAAGTPDQTRPVTIHR